MDYPKAIIELKPSKLVPGQVGLFAVRNLKKGDIIAENHNFDESRLITWSEYEKLDKLTKAKLIDFCCKYEKGINAPQNINNISIPWHINHSCDPNVFCSDKGDYVIKKNVKKGAELTIDVETLMTKPSGSFNCECKSKNCRKKIML